MRLDELIKYVWENELKADNKLLRFVSQVDSVVEVDMSGQVRVYGQHYGNELFTVEVEEELTEHTVFDELHEYFWDLEDGLGITEIHTNESISGIQEEHDEETVPFSITVRRRADNEPTLIWSKDTGIPVEGVIEV